jgi:hypothetical protein
MRSVFVVGCVLAVACGSSAKTAPPPKPVAPPAPVAKAPAAPVVEDTRLVLSRKVLAALSGGEVEALVTLADKATLLRQVGDCKVATTGLNLDPMQEFVAEARGNFTRHASKAKGLKIEVLELANTVDRTKTATTSDNHWVKKGDNINPKCTVRVDVLVHEIAVKIRAQRDTNPAVEQTVKITALELDGRWYLLAPPARIKERDTGKEMEKAVAKLGEFRDRMCKCKAGDKACADKVSEEVTAWSLELARNGSEFDDTPDPELMKRASEITSQYAECATKAMQSEP